MGRRGSDDVQWRKVKSLVQARDRGRDRILSCISALDFLKLKQNAGPLLQRLDPAHCLSVGDRPDLTYCEDNIVLLNRFSHDCLDSFKNPITGESIYKEEADLWWQRILGEKQWGCLMALASKEIDYGRK